MSSNTTENPYITNKDFDINKAKIWYSRASFGKEEIEAVNNCLNEFQLSPGKYTFEFERKVAKLFGKEHAIMTNSGSSANLLVAELLDIKPEDEIISGAEAFPTTISPFLLKGATAVLVDSDPDTLTPKLVQVEQAINKHTKAIIVAHLFGSLNNMAKLRELADHYKIKLIEDSCDSLGQTIDGLPSGRYADYSTTSFYPAHVITAGGGGGMLVVPDVVEEKRAKAIRDWGRTGTDSENPEERFNVKLAGEIPYDAKFFYGEFGYNLKSTEMNAAFGLAQLEKLGEWNQIRRGNHQALEAIINNFPLYTVHSAIENGAASWLAFPFLVGSGVDRKALAIHLEKNDIQTRPLMAGNLIKHPAYKEANIRTPFGTNGADTIARYGMVIGLHPGIGKDELAKIESVLKEFFSRENVSLQSHPQG